MGLFVCVFNRVLVEISTEFQRMLHFLPNELECEKFLHFQARQKSRIFEFLDVVGHENWKVHLEFNLGCQRGFV
jgi:hypothetical protein